MKKKKPEEQPVPQVMPSVYIYIAAGGQTVTHYKNETFVKIYSSF